MQNELNIVRNALMLATLCGGFAPLLTFVVKAIPLSNRVLLWALVVLTPALFLSIISAIVGVFSDFAGNTIFVVSCGFYLLALSILTLLIIFTRTIGRSANPRPESVSSDSSVVNPGS